uniref:MD-2-related lipid-recognition domain-containing protein n=2 Tax=Heliothis virescens TaxID=7102 RepID=A0A2A4J0X6_HELVI
MFLVYVVLLLQLAIRDLRANVIFQDCGSAYELMAVSIDGCDWRMPCYVTVGEDVPVSLDFYADSVSRNLDQNVVIHINHLNLRTRVSPERCEIYDCAVTTGMVTSFTSVMSVPTTIALNQRGYLYWRIENEKGQQVLCYSVMVQTQSPLQKLMRKYLTNTVPATLEKQP